MIPKDTAVRERLARIYRDEVIPGFVARAMGDEATRYVASTLERFENPFLDHPPRDIAQNHALKIDRRIEAFLGWVRERNSAAEMAQLTALVAAHRA